jgi:hypothetical protein
LIYLNDRAAPTYMSCIRFNEAQMAKATETRDPPVLQISPEKI